jgi:hypothetical protein
MPEAQKVTQAQATDAVRALQIQAFDAAQRRGFHAGNKTHAESLAFVVRSLGLAMGYLKPGKGRKGSARLTEIETEADGKPVGFPIKLADAVIGILDCAASCGIDLGDAIARKTAWNAARAKRG